MGSRKKYLLYEKYIILKFVIFTKWKGYRNNHAKCQILGNYVFEIPELMKEFICKIIKICQHILLGRVCISKYVTQLKI